MIYESLSYNEQWIRLQNISYSVLLILLLGFSFLRTWFSSKKISKKYCLINHIHPEKNDYWKRIVLASVFSEIMTYVFFCIIFEIKYSDYPTIPIVNGLSIVVWDFDNRFEGIIKLLTGIFIWFILNVTMHIVLLSKQKTTVLVTNRIKIGLTASVKNIPFFFAYQVILVFYMWFRTNELHVLQLYASGEM